MTRVRVLHFLNQFFAGIGGETKADVPVDYQPGALGPGIRLQSLCGGAVEITVTAYCGDNYFSKYTAEALGRIMQIAREYDINMVVAGPAFASGRYGLACAEVCHSLSTS